MGCRVSAIVRLSWEAVNLAADALASRWAEAPLSGVYGIPQGGSVPAVLVAHRLRLPLVGLDEIDQRTLIVDDLVDSGRTARDLFEQIPSVLFDALYRKPASPTAWGQDATTVDGWIAFPWERDGGDPTDAVVRLLQHIGEDPNREGLVKTPERVVKALREMTAGYGEDPVAILNSARFHEANSDEVIIVGHGRVVAHGTPEQIAKRTLDRMRGGGLFDLSTQRSERIIAEEIRKAVEAEREACAQIADQAGMLNLGIVASIRARGAK